MSRTIIRIFDAGSFDSIICTCGRCKDSPARGCHHTTSIAIGPASGAETQSLPPPSPPSSSPPASPLPSLASSLASSLFLDLSSLPPPPPNSPPPPPPLPSDGEFDRDSIDPDSESESESESDSDATVGETRSDSESSTVHGGDSCSSVGTDHRSITGRSRGESPSPEHLSITPSWHEPDGGPGAGRDRARTRGTIGTRNDRADYDTGYHSVKDVDIDAIRIVKAPSVAALMTEPMPADVAITFPLQRERTARGLALRRCESVGSGDLLRGAKLSCVTLKNRIQSALSFRTDEERERPRRPASR
ncbi:hypothetical protein FJT64_000686 [Amphibalanus amphitrite]|uniref:Uncharacterized protein n=1 Tax=Amphibalanus amphitrite TaxID=1232801 RepID=A0A6A4VQP6_AMPAM|nr:hypothetical protein FJT64_000686 [Amphibalanus amphitrite]